MPDQSSVYEATRLCQVIFLRPAADGYFEKVFAPKLGAEMIKSLDEVASAFVQKIQFV